MVVRKWNNRDYGPGGKVVLLTNETVDKPLAACDAYDDRSLIEHCCLKESQQAWNLKHPPQKTERAVQVHVFFTLAMFALATAYRVQAEQAAVGDEPMGWQRWRRQRIQQHRDTVIIFAQGWYGIFWDLPCRGILPPARGETQRTAPGGRKSSRRTQEIRAHGTCVAYVGISVCLSVA